MKRVIYTILCMILIIIYSCEKDDFCLTNPVTPNLIIRLYDIDDRDDTKTIDSLSIWAINKDTLSTYYNITSDSIVVPLNTLATNTVYVLANGTQKSDTITINYNTEDEYVSRSCGFRVIFNEVLLNKGIETSDNTWISAIERDTITTINSQESAHVKIYH